MQEALSPMSLQEGEKVGLAKLTEKRKGACSLATQGSAANSCLWMWISECSKLDVAQGDLEVLVLQMVGSVRGGARWKELRSWGNMIPRAHSLQ